MIKSLSFPRILEIQRKSAFLSYHSNLPEFSFSLLLHSSDYCQESRASSVVIDTYVEYYYLFNKSMTQVLTTNSSKKMLRRTTSSGSGQFSPCAVTPSPMSRKEMKSALSLLLDEKIIPVTKSPRFMMEKKKISDFEPPSLMIPLADSFNESYGDSASEGAEGVVTYSDSFFDFGSIPVVTDKSSLEDVKERFFISNTGPSAIAESSTQVLKVSDLLFLILEDAKVGSPTAEERLSSSFSASFSRAFRPYLNEKENTSPNAGLLVFPAEEDGTPMNDLPTFSAKTDLLQLGVKDFAIIDQKSLKQLAHVRIEGNSSFGSQLLGPGEEFNDDGDEENGESSYYILSEEKQEEKENRKKSASYSSADIISVFRMDSDEPLFKKTSSLDQTEPSDLVVSKVTNKGEESRRRSLSQLQRRRSSSGNLIISYRWPNSDKWRIAKHGIVTRSLYSPQRPLSGRIDLKSAFPVVTQAEEEEEEGQRNEPITPVPTERPLLTTKKSSKLSIFSSSAAAVLPIINPERLYQLEEDGFFRRHSERPYNEEIDGSHDDENDTNRQTKSDKNPRNQSFSGKIELYPHTSLSEKSQYSPSHALSASSTSASSSPKLSSNNKKSFPSPSPRLITTIAPFSPDQEKHQKSSGFTDNQQQSKTNSSTKPTSNSSGIFSIFKLF
jgi:hypothetical protein